MTWLAPPTRREVSLVLFCLTAFILGYNLEVSLSSVGLDASRRAAISKRLGMGENQGFERDGRRPKAWRDQLEKDIVGDYEWREGEVMRTWGEGHEWERYGYKFSDLRDEDITWKHAASVLGPQKGLEDVTVVGPSNPDEGKLTWGIDMPTSRIVTHVPGFTILDNVVYANGTMFVVSYGDLPSPISSIASSSADPSRGPSEAEWQVIRPEDAATVFGDHASRISGVSLMSTDPSPLQDNYTLISLCHAYFTLDQDMPPSGVSALPPPMRLIYTTIPTYSDHQPHPESHDPEITRPRSRQGLHPYLLKAAFPTVGVWYAEDWDDLRTTEVPFLLERVVLLDRSAAQREGVENGLPLWAGVFTRMQASQHWFTPIRRTLAGYLGVDLDAEGAVQSKNKKKAKPVITYITRQGESDGPRLRAQDHQLLVDALRGLEKHYGYGVHVVSRETEWNERMSAILRSTMVLSVYGDHLSDAVFMQPSARATLMEFFPPNVFARDREIPAASIGVQYMAWWNDRKMSGDSLPSPTPLPASAQRQEITLDANAVAQAVREELSRRS
ncbi:hypothetical protein NEOLEDRAFT_1179922 [Neolentinus lepideus HHB14362 ss-1]|uniref:Uncharacterized protein n=1 Tax=Neolentinus lepideus HHB14362 ss-1 TaxID=1314782 RepID=A0A165REM3_9AGAM|nr:hypothetical protein NEOLEDRAFT_1179922 [Neolentinus lepideus HHB14362 ss-1]